MNRVDLHQKISLTGRSGRASLQCSLQAHLELPRLSQYTLASDAARAATLLGDDALLARVRTGAARALQGSALSRQGGRIRRRPTRVIYLAAAAVVLLATLTAGATFVRRAYNRVFARNVEQTIASDHSNGTSRRPNALPVGRDRAEQENAAEAPALAPPEALDPAKSAVGEEPARAPSHAATRRAPSSRPAARRVLDRRRWRRTSRAWTRRRGSPTAICNRFRALPRRSSPG
jgi:hypothetical protein